MMDIYFKELFEIYENKNTAPGTYYYVNNGIEQAENTKILERQKN